MVKCIGSYRREAPDEGDAATSARGPWRVVLWRSRRRQKDTKSRIERPRLSNSVQTDISRYLFSFSLPTLRVALVRPCPRRRRRCLEEAKEWCRACI